MPKKRKLPAWYRDRQHPAWALIRSTIQIGGLVVFLLMTSNNFDANEYKAVSGMIGLNLMLELFGLRKSST